MRRIATWEKELKAALEKHMALPSEYGVSDCYLICDDAVFAMTGEHINDAALAGYDSPIKAAKLMKRNGFSNVADVFAARFETVPTSFAQRGDIGVIENANGEICGGVFTALGFAVRDENEVLFLPNASVRTAYKVGR